MPANANKTNDYNDYTLVEQIALNITHDIDKGIYKRNEQLLSINNYSRQYGVARDTIEKAYNKLKIDGYIRSIKGKGYFVIGKPDSKIKVLLLFNKLSSYKKTIYDAIVETLGDKGKADLYIHHYNPLLLEECIDKNVGNYHYYVVMPHFFDYTKDKDYLKVMKKIPADRLILLDKNISKLPYHSAVYQDFRNDIYHALQSLAHLLDKYRKITIVFPMDRHHPLEIQDGIAQFCDEKKKQFHIAVSLKKEPLEKGAAYIVLNENDLADLIKETRKLGLKPGKDVGIISFNETVFKELLDITVITTDFELMGKTTADHILSNNRTAVKNPFNVIVRKSL